MTDHLPLFAPQFGGSFPPPRPWQDAAHEALREGARNGHRCQLLMAPTGSGKTYQAMRIIHEALLRHRRAMFVCDRKTLINQTSAVASDYGLHSHGILQAQNPRMDPRKHFQIASLQTLAMRGWPETDVVIIDECFPAGTFISMPHGLDNVDIARVSSGDYVMSAMGPRRVLSTFSKTVYRTVIMELSDGSKIESTPEHPVFTGMGWRHAASLVRGERCLRLQDMPKLWEQVLSTPSQVGSEGWMPRGGKCVLQQADLWKILCEEVEEPDAQPRDEGESCREATRYWAQTSNSRGEWASDADRPVCLTEDAGGGLGWGVRDTDETQPEGRIPVLLQSGHCEPRPEDRGGSGWILTHGNSEESAGREEGWAASLPWVESIKVVEHPRGITVYNLRVEGHPSYFANGILVHNCHTQYKTWRDYIKNHPETRVIGLSATPFSVGLGRLFTNLVNVTTMDALTKEGILVPMRIYTCHRPDMRGAATQGGEWTDAAAAERELAIVGDVVSEWVRLAEGRKTICFGATIAHCEEIVRRFNEAGIRASTFTAKTTEEERRIILEEFGDRPGEIHILVSVEALAKGFDVRDVGCIMDCRPLRKSLSTAIQMWGRGLRSSPETGKADCILLDFSGNIIRFADDFADVYFNGLSHLDQGEKLDKTIRKDEEKAIRKCPQCGYMPMGKTCIMCGYQAKRTNLVQHQAGTMEAFAIGQKVYAESKADLYAQLAAYAKIHSLPERVKGRTAHLYKDFTGSWPPNGWDPYTVPAVRPTRETMNKIRSLTIAFSKRRTA